MLKITPEILNAWGGIAGSVVVISGGIAAYRMRLLGKIRTAERKSLEAKAQADEVKALSAERKTVSSEFVSIATKLTSLGEHLQRQDGHLERIEQHIGRLEKGQEASADWQKSHGEADSTGFDNADKRIDILEVAVQTTNDMVVPMIERVDQIARDVHRIIPVVEGLDAWRQEQAQQRTRRTDG